MKDWQNQAHVKWECKYHVVILPKYRRKALTFPRKSGQSKPLGSMPGERSPRDVAIKRE